MSTVISFIDLIAKSNDVAIVRRAMHDIAILGRLTNDLEVQPYIAKHDMTASPAIPEGWQWGVLEDVTTRVHYGYTASASRIKTDVKMLRITDIQDDRVNWATVPYCDIETDRADTYSLQNGDLLIARTGGTIGKTYLAEGIDCRAVFASYLIRATPNHLVLPRFLKAYTSTSLYWQQLYTGAAGTGQPNVNASTLKKLRIPLPPLEEQKRIVAKVDQLMALCDELEAKQTAQRHLGTRLTRSALDALTTATTPDEFTTAWHRIVDNFETLVGSRDKVDGLRKAVIGMAVRGLLPNKGNWTEGSTTDGPYTLPVQWKWVRLADLCERITKGSSPKWQGVSYVEKAADTVLFVTSENVGSGKMLLERPKYVEARFNEIEPRSILRRGDLLMNIVGASIGRVAMFDSEDLANINQAVCIIRLDTKTSKIDHEFLLLFLNSPTCINYMFDKQVDNARANLSMGNIAEFMIPLPPPREQKHIVAESARLLQICDELEARFEQSESCAANLAAALVQQLVIQ